MLMWCAIIYLTMILVSSQYLISRTNGVLPIWKVFMIAAIFPLELIVLVVGKVYALFGIYVYLDIDTIVTDEEYEEMSDEFKE